ncbi:hypothetical protein Tco_1416032 [Tanacetum coccineum]
MRNNYCLRGSGKTTKETLTTITPTTATATTTIITSNKIGDKKLLGPMLRPQLMVRVMLEIYPSTIAAAYTIKDDALQSKSFVCTEFTRFIDITYATLDTSYEVELADGKVVSTNTVLRGCTLALFDHLFKIDLLPTRLGIFDVIVEMDWLSYHRGVIVCYEKIVCISLPNGEILEIQGERPEKDPKSLSCIKADEKNPGDILYCALPVVRAPYHLAPSEMLELSNQLKELQEKGFI